MFKRQKLKLNSGDIFIQELSNNKYILGRILLNFETVFEQKKILPYKTFLSFFKYTYLVEGYDIILNKPEIDLKSFENLNVLIRGIYMDNYAVVNKLWKIIGNYPVRPENIDFPIYLYNDGGIIKAVRGEIGLTVDIDKIQYWDHNVLGTIHSGATLDNYILNYLGKNEWIDPEWRESSTLSLSDIRYNKVLFNTLENQIWELLHSDYQSLSNKYFKPVKRLL